MKRMKYKDSDRIFSLSSVTSPHPDNYVNVEGIHGFFDSIPFPSFLLGLCLVVYGLTLEIRKNPYASIYKRSGPGRPRKDRKEDDDEDD